MISRFFIDRPIFATVLSLVITLAGAVAVLSLPVAQYPNIAPPTVMVTASYPGANAETVRDVMAAPIEQEVNGVENMLYMSSQSTNDGNYQLTITFKLGTDADLAQVLVQNRVALALPVLPDLVRRQGVHVTKVSNSVLMIVNLVSTRDAETGEPLNRDLYLSNYATIQIKDELGRLPGVGNVTLLGERDYSMRIWLDPAKLADRRLASSDVVRAIQEQNLQVAAGQIGQQPLPPGQQFQLTINTLGRLVTVEQFGNIIVKVSPAPQGAAPSIVHLRDVARVERGSQQYDQSCTVNGQPSLGLSIYPLPGSNALQTAQEVTEKMAELKKRFPPGLDYMVIYDTTPFIQDSIDEVFRAMGYALVLVALVVLLFLQNWRAALIPLVAVPVAIVGTFAALALFGFSLNNLTLFGLVLAIGIVVDDAIVVVENVERWLARGLPPRDAAVRAMEEVTGPVVAVTLVLTAVFVPSLFIGGIPGQFFRQFAITLSVSTLLSAFNSLTLSPALAALLLKPHTAQRDPLTRLLDAVLGWFFRLFNRAFALGSNGYTATVALLLRGSMLTLVGYVGLLVLTYQSFRQLPAGFIPEQDKGYLLVNVQLPDSSSVQRTQAALRQIDQIARRTEGVESTVSISGQSLLVNANAPNLGWMYVILKKFDDRPGLPATAVGENIRRACDQEIHEALVDVFGAPPIDGLGSAGGFKLVVEDRANLGAMELQQASDQIVRTGNCSAEVEGLFSSPRFDTPWIYLDIDRAKCLALGVSLNDVFSALQINIGSYYVNNFNEFGRSWQVNVMADNTFRKRIADLKQLKVSNRQGDLVPLSTLLTIRDTTGPASVTRYNTYAASIIYGNPRSDTSSGQAISRMDEIARESLARGLAFDWTDVAFFQQQAGNKALGGFALAVLFVFLVLAAQYESWSLPLAVILVVPMCLLCAAAGVAVARLDNNIFTQIGLIVLVGLASKNAILIVEFARQLHSQGKPRRAAVLEACQLRLRPILMTSLAFILGVVPLVIAQGAGAEMRRALGTTVFAGMLGVTFFGLFLTPVFFDAITRSTDRRSTPPQAAEEKATIVREEPLAASKLDTAVTPTVTLPSDVPPPG